MIHNATAITLNSSISYPLHFKSNVCTKIASKCDPSFSKVRADYPVVISTRLNTNGKFFLSLLF